MRIATWNVNSIRARVDHVVQFLKNQNIDILLIQEIKCINEVFPRGIFEDLGYNCAVFGQKTFNGVAILSKFIIEDLVLGSDIFENDNSARYIECFTNGLRVASVYVPNGQEVNCDYYFFKLKFLEQLKLHLKNILSNERMIIGGDFNIAREDIDVYNPILWNGKNCCSNPERILFKTLLDLGLRDSHREMAGLNRQIFTWWDYRMLGFKNNRGLRLDYILTSNDISITSCYRDLEMRGLERPSDHAPVIADITL